MVALAALVVAASVYLVYVLEILKFRGLDATRLRRLRPDASPAEIESGVVRDFETGEFQAVSSGEDHGVPLDGLLRAEQRIGKRQVDEDRVSTEDERGGPQAPIAADRG